MPRICWNDSALHLYKAIVDARGKASIQTLAKDATKELQLNGQQRVICMASSRLTHAHYPNDALTLLNTIPKKNWNTHLYNSAATAYNGLGQHQNAENTWSEGINLNPNNIPLRIMFSLFLLNNESRSPDLIKHVTFAIQHSTQNTTPLYLLARATYNGLCPKEQFNAILNLCPWVNQDRLDELIRASKEGPLKEWEEAIRGITRSGLFSALERFDISAINRVAYRVATNKLHPVEFV